MFLGVIYLPHLKTINLVGLWIPDTVWNQTLSHSEMSDVITSHSKTHCFSSFYVPLFETGSVTVSNNLLMLVW